MQNAHVKYSMSFVVRKKPGVVCDTGLCVLIGIVPQVSLAQDMQQVSGQLTGDLTGAVLFAS
jgi:hypothetical protein